MADFVHLHNHSEYSLLDGANRVKNLVKMAAEHEMPAIALTDHGVMSGTVEFALAAQEAGVKPICGFEAYTSGDRPHTGRDKALDRENYHLLLLAQNEEGYRNLVKLCSIAHTDGYYYKPRIDRELLSRHASGVIGTTACLGSEVNQALLAGDYDKAKRVCGEYAEILPYRFYIELQDHGQAEDKQVNPQLIQLANELSLPLIATNDIHYGKKEDHNPHDVLLCIGTGSKVQDEKRMRYPSPEFYFKGHEEMKRLFKDVPQALANTVRLAETVDFQMKLGDLILPHFQVPEGETYESWFEKCVWEGAKKRYPQLTARQRQRIEHELHVIKAKGYAAYFLIVADFVHWAHSRGIPARCRGSAAGSVVSYLLNITNIDPLEYNLLFERFFYMERITPPDIDLDFADYRRGEVIEYCREKYGPDHVAQIITYGTLGAKAAIRDVGRAMDIPLPEVDRLAKMIPVGPKGGSIKENLETNADMADLYEKDHKVKEWLDTAQAIEGLSRHSGIHAAGVVITPGPVSDYCPVQTSDTGLVTQYDMGACGNIGLLKMDFLGLRTLTVVEHSLRLIRERHGLNLDIDEVPRDDAEVFRLISSGHTAGIFQLESEGIRGLCREIRPSCIDDLISLVALYRPGPLGNGDTKRFIARRNLSEPVTYPDPAVEEVLQNTYGLFVFQDQILQICLHVAKMSAKDADNILRAMSKKKMDKILAAKPQFVEAMRENAGVEHCISEQIFETMAEFAKYGFNRNHSGAYAILTYQTAWLKHHYPAEFMAAVLTSISDDTDKVVHFIDECKRTGIEVAAPDVNASGLDFAVDPKDGKRIVFGLGAIKGIGDGPVSAILDARQDGPFLSLFDFCRRIDPSRCQKSAIELIVKAGGFDTMHKNRQQALAGLESAYAAASRTHKERLTGQFGLFDELVKEEVVPDPPMPDVAEFSAKERLALERELLGLYLSDHPLRHYEERVRLLRDQAGDRYSTSAGIPDRGDKEEVVVVGLISHVKTRMTKNGDPMAFIHVEDLKGKTSVTLFPKAWERCSHQVMLDAAVAVRGRISRKEGQGEDAADQVEVLAEELLDLNGQEMFSGLAKVSTRTYQRVLLDLTGALPETVTRLKEILRSQPGESQVVVFQGEQRVVSNMKVKGTQDLARKCARVLGERAVALE